MPDALLPFAALVSILGAITVTPDPVAFQLGPIPVFWYGVCYAVGLAATYMVITREARRRGLNAALVDNGIIIVAVAALIGGRLYHVIDQWPQYQDDLLSIIMPPYTGLGVYGGILTGVIVAWIILRVWKQSFWRWADVIAPGIFVMQAIGRWGNFFNQELYGPPTDLPWGIAIDCVHRVPQYPCAAYPFETTFFHPLFLYESVSGILGAVTLLYIARRWGARMRPGDLFLLFLVWYATVRLVLETLRTGNWVVFGIPTAMLISAAVIVGTLIVLAYRHRPGAADDDRWGDPPVVIEDPTGTDDTIVEDVPADDTLAALDDALNPGAADVAGTGEAVADDGVTGGTAAVADDVPPDGGGDAPERSPGA